jgi:hypothetical protein
MSGTPDPQESPPSLAELLDVEEASAILEVPVDQVLAMVEQGVITAEEGSAGPRFRRAELIAARELGG